MTVGPPVPTGNLDFDRWLYTFWTQSTVGPTPTPVPSTDSSIIESRTFQERQTIPAYGGIVFADSQDILKNQVFGG